MHSPRTAAIVASLLLACAPVSNAQSWRTVTKVRHVAAEDQLDVNVRYGAGVFRLRAAESGVLYRMRLRYDEDVVEPLAELSGNDLEVGIRGSGRIRGWHKDGAGELELELVRGIPIDLNLEIGATRSIIDLGGLSLMALDVSAGASESTISISEPNPVRLRAARFQVGAVSFRAEGLQNLNAERIELKAGVGEVTLDFSGQPKEETTVDVEMGLGSLTLRFPRGVGVRIIKNTFLASFDSEGLLKQGDTYLSPDWESAPRRVTVQVKAALGSIDVQWVP